MTIMIVQVHSAYHVSQVLCHLLYTHNNPVSRYSYYLQLTDEETEVQTERDSNPR